MSLAVYPGLNVRFATEALKQKRTFAPFMIRPLSNQFEGYRTTGKGSAFYLAVPFLLCIGIYWDYALGGALKRATSESRKALIARIA